MEAVSVEDGWVKVDFDLRNMEEEDNIKSANSKLIGL